MNRPPILYVVIPCYNEEKVLPETSPMFLAELDALVTEGKIRPGSRIMFVDDGSRDSTWEIIRSLAASDERFVGIRQSRNRGHQNAVLAGLTESRAFADAVVSVDCDGQDDVTAIGRMVDEYLAGSDIVYGVRSDRKSDTFLKRTTAEGYYKLLDKMGVEVVFNHADFRLTSARVIDALGDYHETNLFLRGLIPTVGFTSSVVSYERRERLAGGSHYSLPRMLSLAADGITGFSVKPLHLITAAGAVLFVLSLAGLIASLITWLGFGMSSAPAVIASVFLALSVQLVCTGIVGEYVGRIMTEVKARPRFIISERTYGEPDPK